MRRDFYETRSTPPHNSVAAIAPDYVSTEDQQYWFHDKGYPLPQTMRELPRGEAGPQRATRGWW